ncbi:MULTISPECIES: ROK family protein [Reichenbachiella]|uniref:Glucokinase n=1 Tax=Reichenbachiella agariperforans TaxID=156994 RepID=A0A1M6KLS2_REIAG|nr:MULTISPECIES: ROK family protein [Reichenbachiella]MBU2913605.1 ROK family protein [Reichenbachiella agariperforans]RJE74442.1 glucokinase [Reichenbachiella sp. MSK19-1]SHJ59869.1 glucokinase [Reichenbachiella agariperforans]
MESVIVGIDIGGTGTKFGLVDNSGNLLCEDKIDTGGETFDHFVSQIVEAIQQMLVQYPDCQLEGVGVGAPGGNYYTGMITGASNLPWSGDLPLVEKMSQYFDVPVVLSNDANATAMGEKVFGGAKGMKDFVMITLGTGLGSGIVSSGNLLIGSDSLAAEYGHVLIKGSGGRDCNCGRKGCLETYVSATGIKRTMMELLAKYTTPSVLRGVAFDDLYSRDIATAANAGDALAQKAFRITGKVLGRQLANLVAVVNPEAIFLFGGLALADGLILDPTRKHLEKNLLGMYKGKVKLMRSQLGTQGAAIVGAASLAYQFKDYLQFQED